MILNYPRERSTIASLRHPNGRTAMTPAAPRSGSIMRSLARVLLVLSAFAVPSSAGATADDHFAQLGVPFGAPMEDVKAQFRKLARQYHPDKNKNNDSTASEKFLRISEAHAILTDEAKRAEARAASAPARLPRPPQPHGRGGARVFRAVRWRRSSRAPTAVVASTRSKHASRRSLEPMVGWVEWTRANTCVAASLWFFGSRSGTGLLAVSSRSSARGRASAVVAHFARLVFSHSRPAHLAHARFGLSGAPPLPVVHPSQYELEEAERRHEKLLSDHLARRTRHAAA